MVAFEFRCNFRRQKVSAAFRFRMFVDQNITTETWKIARLEITTKPILTLESLSNDVRMSTMMENTVQEAVLEIAEDENVKL